jgi:DNA-binding CsgD family transcriptional regulator
MEFRFTDAPSSRILHEGSYRIFDERVDFCLAIDKICVLVRRLVRHDGATFSQVLEVDNESLFELATADLYEQRLEACYALLSRKCEAAAAEIDRTGLPIIDAGDAIDNLNRCSGEGELLAHVRAIVHRLGANQFTYQWLRFEGASPASGDLVEARYLIGCRPAWMQQYIARLWYMNDPYVAYARSNIAPALRSNVAVHRVDHWLFSEAQAHGFSNMLVAPVHHHGHGMVGLLQVGSDIDGIDGERLLWGNRRHFRALSSELLDWYTEEARRQAVCEFRLSESETGVLRILRDGGQAKHVADQLGVSIHTVYKNVFPGINKKLGAGRITEAVELAGGYGLLD